MTETSQHNARALISGATARLEAAGIQSAAVDAELLMAHVRRLGRFEATRGDLTLDQAETFAQLVDRRAQRVPLQYLTGTAAFRYRELQVGEDVFVPRPETEVMVGWGLSQIKGMDSPVVVDLCSGSGAIAGAIATEHPGAVVSAIELSEQAAGYAAKNLTDTDVDLIVADVNGVASGVLQHLVGKVDLVLANPPYIPLIAWESVVSEARDHEPHAALFAGDDGLDVIRVISREAHALLKPGGWLGCEHADSQGEVAPAVFVEHGGWHKIRDYRDLAGRQRFVTAQRGQRGA